ncbi:MAG: alpha/beta fold hydrolase [Caldilineaceae bacterium]
MQWTGADILRAIITIQALWLFYLFLFRKAKPLQSFHVSRPTTSFATAMDRAQLMRVRDDAKWRKIEKHEALNPICCTGLLTHGKRTESSIVFFHGLTNCPYQFHKMAQMFHKLGYNVLIPRLPHHGHANHLTERLAHITAEKLFDLSGDAVDVACGLGERVTVVGFSLGGVLASWVAQTRADVERVIIISPALATKAIPIWLNDAASRTLPVLPNRFMWWDPETRNRPPSQSHAYPRFSTRAVGHLLRAGQIVYQVANTTRPKAQSIIMSLNPCDEAVDNRGAIRLVESWQQHGANVYMHQFDPSWNLAHDIIDPTSPQQQVDRVYPILLRLITNAAPSDNVPFDPHGEAVAPAY